MINLFGIKTIKKYFG